MATIITRTVRPSTHALGVGDYTSLAAWEAGEQRDLVALDQIARAECYAMADGRVSFGGWVCDATRGIQVVVPTAERHAGRFDATKYYVRSTTSNSPLGVGQADLNLSLVGVQVSSEYDSQYNKGIFVGSHDRVRLSITSCIGRSLYPGYDSGQNAGVYAHGAGDLKLAVTNSVFGQYSRGIGINASEGTAAEVSLHNNTVYGSLTHGFYFAYIQTLRLKNNLAFNTTSATGLDYRLVSIGSAVYATNLSEDATAPGADAIHNATVVFVDAANLDLHLASADVAAKGKGTNLYADSDLPVTADMDGQARPRTGAFDIGADQATPPPPPTLAAPPRCILSASAEGMVSVPVTGIPEGGRVRAEYAVSPTQPDSTSGAWTFLDHPNSERRIDTPALAPGETVWVRLRSEKDGLEPSAWTVLESTRTPETPVVQGVQVTLDRSGVPTVNWSPNRYARGVRIRYTVHKPGTEPVFNDHMDHGAASNSVALPTSVPPGKQISVGVRGWEDWDGEEVSGTTSIVATSTQERAMLQVQDADTTASDTERFVFQGSVVSVDANGVATFNLDGRYLQLSGGTVFGALSFGANVRQMVNLWNAQYGIGVQSSTWYARSDKNFSFFVGGSHADSEGNPGGGTEIVRIVAPGVGNQGGLNIKQGWLRLASTAENTGIHWEPGTVGASYHIYPANPQDMRFRTGADNGGIVGTIQDETPRGYVHWTTDNKIGFLDHNRSWALICDANGVYSQKPLYPQQPLALGDMGWAGYGYMQISGRVLSGNNNIHLSPPNGANVIIDTNYRQAGGPGGGTAGLIVSGEVRAPQFYNDYGHRMAAAIVSTNTPSGTAAEGTLWLRYTT